MTENNILQFKNPSEVESGLEKILQEGAIKMLKQAVEAEIEEFISSHKSRHTEEGSLQIVRNGYLPKRTIQTGLGHIPVQVPRTRDRCKFVAVMDWYSRCVLSWRLSNTMDFCCSALEEALDKHGQPDVFNTDQGSQFTSLDFTKILKKRKIKISMDGWTMCLSNASGGLSNMSVCI